MLDVRCTNDDFIHLNDGLPPEVARLRDAGNLAHAIALVDSLLDLGDQPALAPVLRVERERMLRTPREFPYTREAALELMRAECPSFSEGDFDRLVDHRRIDWRYVDGEQHYIANFLDSLRFYPKEAPGLAPAPARDISARDAMLEGMRQNHGAARRITLHARVESVDNVAGAAVRAWLPYPVVCTQQSHVELLDATEGAKIAPETAQQRTIHWEAEGVRSFEVTYRYVERLPWVDATRLPVDPAQPDFFLDEQQPHVVFTPYLRTLSHDIVAGTTNPLERARAVYDYVTNRVDYRFQPPYVLLDSIADSCAKSLRGDCGVMTLLFVTMCRLVGVPARWQSGLSVTPDHVGSHDWAMFYVAPRGWLWADCSFGSSARREGEEWRREHYFGNLDPWRMVANTQFFAHFGPGDASLRDDPFDNQLGEMSVNGRGLTRSQMHRSVELVEMEEV